MGSPYHCLYSKYELFVDKLLNIVNFTYKYMNNLIIKPVNKNIKITKFNHKTRAMFRHKKLVQYLLMLSELKIDNVITSYSGTILFDKELSFQEV